MPDRTYEIDHSVFMVSDTKAAEDFYIGVLGEVLGQACLWDRHGTSTDAAIYGRVVQERARAAVARGGNQGGWGSGEGGGGAISIMVGEALIPLFLWGRHIPEPPPGQVKGTPRIALGATREQMEKAVEVFNRHRIPFEDFVHPAPCPAERSIYFRDPSGNFLELSCPRGDGAPPGPERPRALRYADADGFWVGTPHIVGE